VWIDPQFAKSRGMKTPEDGWVKKPSKPAASFKTEMRKRGIWHVDADNEVNDGIRIASMVLNQKIVRFCRQTTEKTIQEMQTYAWDSKAAQRGEEKPLKTRDHGPDAFRYFVKREVPYWRLAWS
jgi:phage terminase large subunit